MANEVSDGLERKPGIDQALHAAVPEGVRAATVHLNAGTSQAPASHLRDAGGADGVEWRCAAPEHGAAGNIGTSVAQILDDGPGNDAGQGECGVVPCLAVGHQQPFALPVDGIEAQRRDLAATQPADNQQQQDCVVAIADPGAPVDMFEDAFDLRPGD